MYLPSTVLIAVTFAINLVSAAAVENGRLRLGNAKQTLQVGEYTITTEVLPIDEALAAPLFNLSNSSPSPVVLEKRAASNVCANSLSPFCINGQPHYPDTFDCINLMTALFRLASETTAASHSPCNYPWNPSCPDFVVDPSTQKVFTLGTCSVMFQNFGAAGTSSYSYCLYALAGVIEPMLNVCGRGQGFANSYGVPTNSPPFPYAIFVGNLS